MVIWDLYQNISLKVKLLDGISDIFYINQEDKNEYQLYIQASTR